MSRSEQSRTPIFPTASASELTTAVELTTAQQNAKAEAAEDLLLATRYYERIGTRQRIHEYAVHRHLKKPTKDSLALVVSTFDSLYRTEMQVPPPLLPADIFLDTKSAIARGRAQAFAEGTPEGDHMWAFVYHQIDGESLERDSALNSSGREMGFGQRRDLIGDSDDASAVLKDAERALNDLLETASRLRSRHECQHIV
ncbi:hypothetical protein C8F04DRAFT_1268835 [Mycena alexandri]|uniref:Uncharacterized protein n=1 Tax=Mycena alexandri TaxID=1745969 RepID=A0AAD6WWD9_9AGAR|nr:hypothetical protein C8F04DRAFT_1268835 [Mycena alexandri]